MVLTCSPDSDEMCMSMKTYSSRDKHRAMVVDYPNRIPRNIDARIVGRYQHQLDQQETMLEQAEVGRSPQFRCQIQFELVILLHPEFEKITY